MHWLFCVSEQLRDWKLPARHCVQLPHTRSLVLVGAADSYVLPSAHCRMAVHARFDTAVHGPDSKKPLLQFWQLVHTRLLYVRHGCVSYCSARHALQLLHVVSAYAEQLRS